MRRGFVVILFSLFCVAFTNTALADYKASAKWFQRLPSSEQWDVQAGLILLGHYSGIVDGVFGKGTFRAITKFEKSRYERPDGILNARDLTALDEMAGRVYRDMGFKIVEDEEAHFRFPLPLILLSQKDQMSRGNYYSSPDEGISLETIRKSEKTESLRSLFARLSASSPESKVTYAKEGMDWFVVSGEGEALYFYTLFLRSEEESVGFQLTWSEEYRDKGAVVAGMLASFAEPFIPQEKEPETPVPEVVPDTPDKEITSFGSFFLVKGEPNYIFFSGDILSSAPLDFRRILRAQPEAKYLVLNSDGGLVDSALIIAHEVNERGLGTFVLPKSHCYSACAFIFLAGATRETQGGLGVHQIWSDNNNMVTAQTTLSDILEALEEFDVDRRVISTMLRTLPDDMYVFSADEVEAMSINR